MRGRAQGTLDILIGITPTRHRLVAVLLTCARAQTPNPWRPFVAIIGFARLLQRTETQLAQKRPSVSGISTP
jgi:hypothetical protein